MPDLPRSHLIAYAVAAIAVLAFGVRQVSHSKAAQLPEGGSPIAVGQDAGGSRSGSGGGARLVVHVAGAVRRPGVYRLREGARVDDAVQRAGGSTRRAELTQLNLAAKLEDGRQVVVPVRTPVSGAPGSSSGASAPAAAAGPLNLNTATLEQLDGLDGVGPATARKILQYREQHGGYGRVEELGQITGIGPKRLAAFREQVTV